MRERSPGTEDSVSYVHKYKLPEIQLYSIVQVKCDPSFSRYRAKTPVWIPLAHPHIGVLRVTNVSLLVLLAK